jgi:hypothetical protein
VSFVRCILALTFQQTNGQQRSSRISRYFPLFVVFVLVFALYKVSLSLFHGRGKNNRDRLEQYPDSARRPVRVWLGQEAVPSKHLPGWSPSSYVGLEADMSKREAIVAAFRVRVHV